MESKSQNDNEIITNETTQLKNDIIENITSTMSKRQLKRMKQREQWEKVKKQIRKNKRERQKAKKQLLKEQQQQQQQQPTQQQQQPESTSQTIYPTRKERQDMQHQKSLPGIKILIDCDFDHLMSDKDINSMSRQISDIYSINRKSETPFNLILYNVCPQLESYLTKNNCQNWYAITIYKKGMFASFDEFVNKVLKTELNHIVYLSADSENEIQNVDNEHVYIIGGIVDRNRYKGLCYNKAKELNISHGRFPIDEYIKMSACKVLTTNHTFAILNKFQQVKNWKEAFMEIIPKRKIDNNEDV